ncbi:hypothetical protein DID88_009238 [Monilinia fructigena]|uniref:Uncharacterized protein n=1 Tax=Monilinia fructigena TaxID=38457 RepID=A0A395IEY3_9HELO|nr:hypothetical protein DID88_009238 [Monilinia fructigena]
MDEEEDDDGDDDDDDDGGDIITELELGEAGIEVEIEADEVVVKDRPINEPVQPEPQPPGALVPTRQSQAYATAPEPPRRAQTPLASPLSKGEPTFLSSGH